MGAKNRKKKKAEEPKPGAGVWRAAAPALALVLLAFLVYVDALKAGFVWDDHNLIEMQKGPESVADFTRLWFSNFWNTDQSVSPSEYYRPLTTTTFMIDRLIHARDPAGYHLTNIIIYCAVCVLAYFLYLKLFGSIKIAVLLGLLFTALPAHTESVAWISGRTDLVCAAFMFGALLAYLYAEETGRPALWAASGALFLLSLFAKEMSVTMVAVVGLHQYVNHGLTARTVARTGVFAVSAALFMVLHYIAAPHLASENVYTTPGAYVQNVLRNLSLGAWYSLAPGGFEYLVTATREQAARTFPVPGGLRLAATLIPLIACAAGIAISFYKKQTLVFLALASGLIAISPVSGIVPIGVVFAVRFLLIPSFFFILFLGAVLSRLENKRVSWQGLNITPAVVVVAPLVAVYAAVSLMRVPDWRDDATLMQSVLEVEPESALAHFIMGNALAEKGREPEAFGHYEKALLYRPEYPEAEFNLGILEQRRGNVRVAEQRYRRAIELRPEFRPARMALIQLLTQSGRVDEARRLLAEDPTRKGR